MSHYITYILTNKTKILATLRTIVIICSILNVGLGGFVIFRHARDGNKADGVYSGESTLIFGIATILAGIIGIIAGIKPNKWIIGIFAFIMVMLIGMNIFGAVQVTQNWDLIRLHSENKIQKEDITKESPQYEVISKAARSPLNTAFEILIMMIIVQAVAFISSMLISSVVHIDRNPVGILVKRAIGQV